MLWWNFFQSGSYADLHDDNLKRIGEAISNDLDSLILRIVLQESQTAGHAVKSATLRE